MWYTAMFGSADTACVRPWVSSESDIAAETVDTDD